MKQHDKALARKIYLYLAALFITSLVVSNLIFQKFFYWYPLEMSLFGVRLFELSVGILPYPITFLITDLISEIYGQKRANEVVVAGIFASFFSIGILLVACCSSHTRFPKNVLHLPKFFPLAFGSFGINDSVFNRNLLIFVSIISKNFTQETLGCAITFPPLLRKLSTRQLWYYCFVSLGFYLGHCFGASRFPALSLKYW